MPEPTSRLPDARPGRVLADPGRFGRPRGEDTTILVAHSATMAALLRTLERLAPTARATLVTGPPGSGKTTVAALAQRLGPARTGAQVTLTKHEDADELARFRALASTSTPVTCFVPELLDLGVDAQGWLLAGLVAHEYAAPGEGLHVIACTTADVDDLLDRGRVRADLYYRLGAVRYCVPPLDLRSDDVAELASAGLRSACRRLGVAEKTLTTAAIDVLRGRHWPGNVRQLHNVVTRAAALSDDSAIGGQTMFEACEPERQREGSPMIARRRKAAPPESRGRVMAALEGVEGNKSAAAARLGISRRSLYRLLDQLGE